MEDIWKYAAGGALIGALGMLAGFWSKIKGVLWRIANLFVQQVEIPTEEAQQRARRLPDRPLQTVADVRPYVRGVVRPPARRPLRARPLRAVRHPQHDLPGTAGFRSFTTTRSRPRPGRASRMRMRTTKTPAKVFSTITFVRGCLNVEKVLLTACEAANHLTWGKRFDRGTGNKSVCHPLWPKRSEDKTTTATTGRTGWPGTSRGITADRHYARRTREDALAQGRPWTT